MNEENNKLMKLKRHWNFKCIPKVKNVAWILVKN